MNFCISSSSLLPHFHFSFLFLPFFQTSLFSSLCTAPVSSPSKIFLMYLSYPVTPPYCKLSKLSHSRMLMIISYLYLIWLLLFLFFLIHYLCVRYINWTTMDSSHSPALLLSLFWIVFFIFILISVSSYIFSIFLTKYSLTLLPLRVSQNLPLSILSKTAFRSANIYFSSSFFLISFPLHQMHQYENIIRYWPFFSKSSWRNHTFGFHLLF